MAHTHRATQIVIAFVLALPARAPAQVARTVGWRAELAVSVARPLVEDGNGTTVKPGIAPVAGVAATRRAGRRTVLTLGVNGSTSTLQLEDDGSAWTGGRTWQADVMLGLEREITRCATSASAGCAVARGAIGGSWIRGPDDVLPFRFGGSGLHPAGEIGVSVRLPVNRPLSAVALAHAFRVGGSQSDDPITEAGTAFQFRLGARYDW